MRIVSKKDDEIVILALPSEEVRKGEYLIIEDPTVKKEMVVQVYDETYLDSSSFLDDIVRDEVIRSSAPSIENDPMQIGALSYLLMDMRFLKCKIRGTFEEEKFIPTSTWLPSRTASKVKHTRIVDLHSRILGRSNLCISIGTTIEGQPYHISLDSLDGQLNIITGKKESGKSHLSKILVSKLVASGAYVIVFDINNEYGGIAKKIDGKQSGIAEKVFCLRPGGNLLFSMDYIGKRTLVNVLQNTLDTPGVSLREFIRIIDTLESKGCLTLKDLGEAILNWKCNEFVRDALYTRYYSLLSSKLFTDDVGRAFEVEKLYSQREDGAVLVIQLGNISSLTRKIVVEALLNKLCDLLESEKVPPTFLFAEEAHLYLRDTYWDDIVTRMRHYGIFTTFITNQPDAIPQGIYRQADNIFLYNFVNSNDLELVSRASTVDVETVKSLVRTLPPRCCLVIGKVAANMPCLVQVSTSDFQAMGETKRFFVNRPQLIAR
ncbi:MAG: ATP-binding protein [Nitrososphaeria archaeon]